MGKVIQGLGLAAVLALGGIAWRIIVIRQAEESMQQIVLAASQQQQAFLEQQQQRQQEQQQRQLALQAQERERRTLSQDQRCVPVTLVLAAASWHLVEKKALRFKPGQRFGNAAPGSISVVPER